MMISAVVGVIALAMGFIAFGYWNSVVKPQSHRAEAEGARVSTRRWRAHGVRFFQNINYQQVPERCRGHGFFRCSTRSLVLLPRRDRPGHHGAQRTSSTRSSARASASARPSTRAFADALRRQLDTTGLHERVSPP
jgi:hypothetical protein